MKVNKHRSIPNRVLFLDPPYNVALVAAVALNLRLKEFGCYSEMMEVSY